MGMMAVITEVETEEATTMVTFVVRQEDSIHTFRTHTHILLLIFLIITTIHQHNPPPLTTPPIYQSNTNTESIPMHFRMKNSINCRFNQKITTIPTTTITTTTIQAATTTKIHEATTPPNESHPKPNTREAV